MKIAYQGRAHQAGGGEAMAIQRSRDPKAFTDFEQEGWATVGGAYDQHFGRLTRQTVDSTLDAAGVERGMKVLDVCSGPGMLAEAALRRGAEAVGLDFSDTVIDIARRNVPGASFQLGDAQSMPFGDDEFDAVVCGYGVIHVPVPEKALSEMHRVLRSGGRAAISVWEAPKPSNGFGVLFGAIKQHGNLDVPLPDAPDFFQFSESATMTGALQSIGLQDVKIESVEQHWDLESSLGIVKAILEGAVRARGVLLAQTETALRAIEDAVKQGMVKYERTPGSYRVPMPAVIGSGAK